jgi:hypothetical protein
MSGDDEGSHDLVFGDVGGWISGASVAPERLGGPRFGLSVGRWMAAYPDYVLQGGFNGFGFIAWRRGEGGRQSGEPMKADTLDALAQMVDHREARATEARATEARATEARRQP